MKQTKHEDKDLGAQHGDAFASKFDGGVLYRFRCGTVPRHCHVSPQFKKQRSKPAYGRIRYPKTLNSLRMNEAHRQEGFRIPKRGRGWLPTAWDDVPGHNEKCWKRHRKTQYKQLRHLLN